MAVNEISSDELLSPERAARISMMRTRYADTIRKAQQILSEAKDRRLPAAGESAGFEKLAGQENGTVSVKKRKETKETNALKRQKALRQREEAERKSKRKREIACEREAARVAINKVTKTVDFDNLSAMKGLEELIGYPCLHYAY